MTSIVLAAFFCLGAPEEGALRQEIPQIFVRAAEHYKALDAKATPLAVAAADQKFPQWEEHANLPNGRLLMPHGWDPKTGKLDMRSIYWWTSGHFPGSLWYIYEGTGDAAIKDRALWWTERLAPVAKYDGNHDTGFMMYCSYGNARRILKTDKYDALLRETAGSLCHRYSDKLGLIRSWGELCETNNFLVIPDNMMNLELLEWAAKNGGEKRFDEIARSHATKTMANHFRVDGGTYHVLDYDQNTGRVKGIFRGQGANCVTAWSRGQGWAIYGYTMMYRETKDPEYLAFAQKVSDYAINHPNMPEDGVPYWDFGTPGEERDTSAAAVMASGLLELSTYVPYEKRLIYREFAVKQLLSLASPKYFAKQGENGDWLLMHGVGHKPAGHEIDVPLDYGDYYFLEALLRFKNLYDGELLASKPAEIPEEWYLDFSRTGNRTRHGKPYGQRILTLERIVVAAHAGMAQEMAPKAEEYMKALLSERAWNIPAHDGDLKSFNGVELSVDLGCARRGETIAEALKVFEKYWDPELVRQVRHQLERRVFEPCLATIHGKDIKQHWWFHTANNWNAVCHKCVVRAALAYYPPDSPKRAEIIKAAVEAMPYYMAGFTDDGYCSEGAGYWSYGFGHFLLLGEALRNAPEKIDIFKLYPKSKLVAQYGFDYHMTQHLSPRFADGGGRPAEAYLAMCREVWPDIGNGELGNSKVFPIAQVFISRPKKGGRLSVGYKGGHNEEFHNHNDLGSYCVAIDDTIVSGDPGGEVYTKRTFSKDRYESKVLNSYAHPVPRVDGILQGTGRQFAAKVLKSEFTDAKDTVVLDLAAAYPTTNLVAYTRTFVYDRAAESFKVTDSVKFAKPSSFVSPLVTHGSFKNGVINHKGKKLSVETEVKGGEWKWVEETVENPGLPDVKLKMVEMQSVTAAEVSFTFKNSDVR